jgi:DNA-binding CsgD family transcriptional regulator
MTRHSDLALVLLELADLGPPSEILQHAPAVAARTVDLDRVLLCSVHSGELFAEALHTGEQDHAEGLLSFLQEHPVALEYPLTEGELFRRRVAQLVRIRDASPAAFAFADLLGWNDYVAAPIVLDTRVIGFLHGDRRPDRTALSEEDAHALASFGVVFAIVFERAALRIRLQAQQREMRRVAAWADARTGELGERLVSLAHDQESAGSASSLPAAPPERHEALRELLTRREIEVLELMVRGETNQEIARELVLSAGTVKFHVKNILRKMRAANRAEATSRYLRLTLARTG